MPESTKRSRFRQGADRVALSMAVLGLAIAAMPLRGQNCTTPGTPNVLTGQYDNLRDSYNSNETCLTSTNLSGLKQVMELKVDGYGDDIPTGKPPPGFPPYLSNPVYAQPLYATINQSLNNCPNPCGMLVVATLNSTLFAYNATTGATIWSRYGSPHTVHRGTVGYALWYQDCTGPQGGKVATPFSKILPFVGTVSTPVIDPSLNVAYLTSYCQDTDTQAAYHWFLHEIDLTTGCDVVGGCSGPMKGVEIPECPASNSAGGWPVGSNSPDGSSPNQNSCASQNPPVKAIQFYPAHQKQWPALLEVDGLIYLAFGTHAVESFTPPQTPSYPAPQNIAYHGWLMAYSKSLATNSMPLIAFSTTSQGGAPGNTLSPGCDISASSSYQNEPNWCGHGAGIWMSGHGPAATQGPLKDGNHHIFMGTGNGGFQKTTYDVHGNVSAASQNYGQSVLDFRESSSPVDTTPFQSFTPNGGGPLAPNPAWGNCKGTCSSFEVQNANDWDMAVSGVLLFDDPSCPNGSNCKHWLVTVDKAGYGYLMQQGNLCGHTPLPTGGNLGPCGKPPATSYANTDPGNIFPFQASGNICGSGSGSQTAICDRVSGLASFFDADTSTQYLYYWPFTTVADPEKLTALQFNPNGANIPSPGGTVCNANSSGNCSAGTDGTLVTGTNTLFTQWLIPGDTITAGTPAQTVTVTQIPDDTHVTVSPAFNPLLHSGAISLADYGGYFINPSPDFTPPPSQTGYPGGALAVSSSNGHGSVVWAVISANIDAGQSSQYFSNDFNRTQGSLWAYQAVPQRNGSRLGMAKLWDSTSAGCSGCQTFCASPYAVPTVVGARVFVPTYAINSDSKVICPTDEPTQQGTYDSGILVYGLSKPAGQQGKDYGQRP